MKKRIASALSVVAVSAVVVGGILTPHVFAKSQEKEVEYFSTTMMPPQPMLGHEKETFEKLKKLSRIGSPYGIFYRVDQEVDLPKSEICTDLQKLTKDQKELVLPYGVFLKK